MYRAQHRYHLSAGICDASAGFCFLLPRLHACVGCIGASVLIYSSPGIPGCEERIELHSAHFATEAADALVRARDCLHSFRIDAHRLSRVYWHAACRSAYSTPSVEPTYLLSALRVRYSAPIGSSQRGHRGMCISHEGVDYGPRSRVLAFPIMFSCLFAFSVALRFFSWLFAFFLTYDFTSVSTNAARCALGYCGPLFLSGEKAQVCGCY